MTRPMLRQIWLSILILASCSSLWSAPSTQPFDLIITNGHIIDGTGSPWYSGDLGIRDGQIAAIGNLADGYWNRST